MQKHYQFILSNVVWKLQYGYGIGSEFSLLDKLNTGVIDANCSTTLWYPNLMHQCTSYYNTHIYFVENLRFCHIIWWTWPGCLAASCPFLLVLRFSGFVETWNKEAWVHAHGPHDLCSRQIHMIPIVPMTYPECRVVHSITLCDLISPHESWSPLYLCWSLNRNVSWTSVFQDLTGKQTIIVSGHHGKLHIDGLRFIIDEGGGYEDKPIAAIVFPSKTLIRSTDVAHWTQRHSFFPCNYCL